MPGKYIVINKRQRKPKGAFTNGQPRDTCSLGHRTKANKTKNTQEKKKKKKKNTDPTKKNPKTRDEHKCSLT